MKAYRIEKKIASNGELQLTALPFQAGETVEVIVLARDEKKRKAPVSLKGKVIAYHDPTEPVAQDDWEVLK